MTNHNGNTDSESEAEDESSVDEEFSELDWHISRLQKALDKLKESRQRLSKVKSLKISRNKLDLSCSKSNLSSNLSGSSTLKHPRKSEQKPVANVLNFKFENEYKEDEYSGEETEDDSDGDDDARACIACPLCDVDIEVIVLYGHLQEDHGFELKNTGCPLCAANLGKDVIGHFTMHHTSSLKYRRKSKKSGLWTSTAAMLGKDLSSFLGSSTNGRGNAHESAPDPLLSPFLGGISHSGQPETVQDESSGNGAMRSSYSKRAEISSLGGSDEADSEERRKRAAFVRQLITSTIF